MDLRAIDILDPDLYLSGVPHERFAFLRRNAPVYWHKEPGGPGFWAITKHEDVIAVSRDAATFSSELRGTQIPDLRRDDPRVTPNNLVSMDPPKHTRYRALLAKAFMPQAIQQVEPYVRGLITHLIDDVIARGRCDVVRDLAGTLPLLVIFEMLGVPVADRDQVVMWILRVMASDDPEYASTPEDIVEIVRQRSAYAHALAAERRRSPRQDVLSLLMAAEVDGQQLTYDEFTTFFFLLLAAGSDTTRNLIANGLLTLLEYPDQRKRLAEDPLQIPGAIEEMLRLHPSGMHFRRTATRDTEIRGHRIAEGDKVVMWYVSANRDEDVFANPHAFLIDRRLNNHVSFGHGPHFCIGNALARMEARMVFEEIVRRLPNLALDGPVVPMRSNWINGLKQMPVRLSAHGSS